jgi:hypothetical protein
MHHSGSAQFILHMMKISSPHATSCCEVSYEKAIPRNSSVIKIGTPFDQKLWTGSIAIQGVSGHFKNGWNRILRKAVKKQSTVEGRGCLLFGERQAEVKMVRLEVRAIRRLVGRTGIYSMIITGVGKDGDNIRDIDGCFYKYAIIMLIR